MEKRDYIKKLERDFALEQKWFIIRDRSAELDFPVYTSEALVVYENISYEETNGEDLTATVFFESEDCTEVVVFELEKGRFITQDPNIALVNNHYASLLIVANANKLIEGKTFVEACNILSTELKCFEGV